MFDPYANKKGGSPVGVFIMVGQMLAGVAADMIGEGVQKVMRPRDPVRQTAFEKSL